MGSAGAPVATSFDELGLDRWLLDTLKGLSMRKPTAVQAACIPHILSPLRRDLVGVAQTGSGKTAAFVLPILHFLHRECYGPFALVLTPTRELAVQIAEQVGVFGRDIGLQWALVTGGMDMMVQVLSIQARPHVIVATPGRLLDVLRSCPDVRKPFQRIRFLVLDEADRLLDSSSTFKNELPGIFDIILSARERPQVLCFTATLTRDVTESKMFPGLLTDPLVVGADRGGLQLEAAKSVDQRYLFIPSKVKECYLYHLLTADLKDRTVIVFVGRCVIAELLCLSLRILNVPGGVVSLHSQNPQRVRLESLTKFRNGLARVLIATDVASRGLDIPSVHAVLNYDLPADPRDYVHRIGRTGRAGRRGTAISLVCELDIAIVQAIEERLGESLKEYAPQPDEDAVLTALNKCSDARQAASTQLEQSGFKKRKK